MTANFVARETGFAMHGWAHGDRTTNEAFAPLEPYGERLDALLRDVRALGFGAIDLWGAHLHPDWATDEHVAIAREALARRGLEVASYAVWIERSNLVRSCELAEAVGTTTIAGGLACEPAELAPVLRVHGVTLAIENHPEQAPPEVLATIEAGAGTMAATVDTGWWATQGYDPARAIEELGVHVRCVHLKDVLHEGEPHETCAWGQGIVDIEACVRALRRIGYSGALTVEHEPEEHDPSEEIRAMREQLEAWLG